MHSQDVYPLDISTRAGFLKEVRIPVAGLQSCHDSFVGFTFRTFARKGPESNRRNLCPCGQCKCSSQRHTEVLGVVVCMSRAAVLLDLPLHRTMT